MRKLRLRKAKQLSHGYTLKWKIQDYNSDGFHCKGICSKLLRFISSSGPRVSTHQQAVGPVGLND